MKIKNKITLLAIWMVCTIALATGSYFKGGHIFSDIGNNKVVTTITTSGQLSGVTGTSGSVVAFGTGGVPTSVPQFVSGNYALQPCETDSGNSGTTKTIDLSTCSAQKSTLTGSVTYTLTNPQTGGAYVLKIATGTGGNTVTWPGTVKWSGGSTPTITATASKTDIVNLYWDGTNYFGSLSQNY